MNNKDITKLFNQQNVSKGKPGINATKSSDTPEAKYQNNNRQKNTIHRTGSRGK